MPAFRKLRMICSPARQTTSSLGGLFFLHAPLALVVYGLMGAALSTAADEAPSGPLIKTAIFTYVYGKPTIPHIMKLADSPAASGESRSGGRILGSAADGAIQRGNSAGRRGSSMPTMHGRVAPITRPSTAPAAKSAASSMPAMRLSSSPYNYARPDAALEAIHTGDAITGNAIGGSEASRRGGGPYPPGPIIPRKSSDAAGSAAPVFAAPAVVDSGAVDAGAVDFATLDLNQAESLSHRTFSYHYPWYFGTVAGSYAPADYAAYRSYYYRYGGWPYYGNWGFFPWAYMATGNRGYFGGGYPGYSAGVGSGFLGTWAGGSGPGRMGGVGGYNGGYTGFGGYGGLGGPGGGIGAGGAGGVFGGYGYGTASTLPYQAFGFGPVFHGLHAYGPASFGPATFNYNSFGNGPYTLPFAYGYTEGAPASPYAYTQPIRYSGAFYW